LYGIFIKLNLRIAIEIEKMKFSSFSESDMNNLAAAGTENDFQPALTITLASTQ